MCTHHFLSFSYVSPMNKQTQNKNGNKKIGKFFNGPKPFSVQSWKSHRYRRCFDRLFQTSVFTLEKCYFMFAHSFCLIFTIFLRIFSVSLQKSVMWGNSVHFCHFVFSLCVNRETVKFVVFVCDAKFTKKKKKKKTWGVK